MHRPTHEPWREAAGNYPYAWHLHGRKRLWEIRVQMRLKEVPKSKLYFGIELADCEAASATARQMKAVLIRAVQGVIGDFYYSDGEDPSEVMPGEEVEPSTFVMPLWAFDQFMVSEAGEEPEITGDLTNVGMLRKDGLKAYAKELQKCINEFSKDKVYTFCIWGISQFLDCIRWEVGGIFPGMTANFSRFGLLKVINIAIYEMPGEHPDARLAEFGLKDVIVLTGAHCCLGFSGPDEIEETKPQSPRAMDVLRLPQAPSSSSSSLREQQSGRTMSVAAVPNLLHGVEAEEDQVDQSTINQTQISWITPCLAEEDCPRSRPSSAGAWSLSSATTSSLSQEDAMSSPGSLMGFSKGTVEAAVEAASLRLPRTEDTEASHAAETHAAERESDQ
ncbi:unnamed protein product, partial [Durusdinium trenchii]